MNEIIKLFCDKHNITLDQFLGKSKIEGSLDLSSLTSIPDTFNPTVGGYLDLRSLTSIPDTFNPTVGGSLDLRSLTSIPDTFNPTVRYNVYLKDGLKCNFKKLPEDLPLFWEDGKYIKADGIFTKVLRKKGNVYHVTKLNDTKEFFLVTDGEGKWSHGDTLKEAKEDLIFKISNRTKDSYNSYTLETELSFEEAIECYRVITGACSFGTKDFVKNRLKEKKKKSYTIKEMIEVTEGEYRNKDFKDFFIK